MCWINAKGQFEVYHVWKVGKMGDEEGFGTRTEEHSCSLAPQPFTLRRS